MAPSDKLVLIRIVSSPPYTDKLFTWDKEAALMRPTKEISVLWITSLKILGRIGTYFF